MTKKQEIDNKKIDIKEVKEKVNEAIAALQVLGYNKKEIEKALEKIDYKELSTEEIIKKGLNLLGR